MLSLEQKMKVSIILNRFVSLQAQFYEYNLLENNDGQGYYNSLIKSFKELNIDFNSLTESDAVLLGLYKYRVTKSDGKQIEIWLIPLHLYHVIPEGTKLVSTRGNEFTLNYNKMPDDDNRSGYLAYGVTLEKDKDKSKPNNPCVGCVAEGSEECADNPCDKVKKIYGFKP